MPQATAYIFAKAAEPGQVKTRLAKSLGNQAACEVYKAILAQTVHRLQGNDDWQVVLAVTPDDRLTESDYWPFALKRIAQGTGDLGQRMYRLLEKATAEQPVVIVGSDIPDLDSHHVTAAFAALKTQDLVFGPARDGGFWLVGASRPPTPELFQSVRWSTATALHDCLANIEGSSVSQLECVLEDVDDIESYRRYQAGTKTQP